MVRGSVRRPPRPQSFGHYLRKTVADTGFDHRDQVWALIERLPYTPATGSNASFAMAGFGNDSDNSIGPITGCAGLVGGEVTSVELRLANGPGAVPSG